MKKIIAGNTQAQNKMCSRIDMQDSRIGHVVSVEAKLNGMFELRMS